MKRYLTVSNVIKLTMIIVVRIMRHLCACDIFTLVEGTKYRPSQLALQLADDSPVGDCVKHL
jgi:hypothetical protein